MDLKIWDINESWLKYGFEYPISGDSLAMQRDDILPEEEKVRNYEAE